MRTLTVSTLYRQPARARGHGGKSAEPTRRVPHIRLSGQLLERHGFTPGARVHVAQNVQGQLVITAAL
jgi:hypothetical protein